MLEQEARAWEEAPVWTFCEGNQPSQMQTRVSAVVAAPTTNGQIMNKGGEMQVTWYVWALHQFDGTWENITASVSFVPCKYCVPPRPFLKAARAAVSWGESITNVQPKKFT